MDDQLAAFVVRAKYEDLSGEARNQVRIRIPDSLCRAIIALDSEPIRTMGDQEPVGTGPDLQRLTGQSPCTMLVTVHRANLIG